MRLLILACSQRKRTFAELMPAIERYDGPAFRVLRAYKRTHLDAQLTVLILSARYGIIGATQPILDYNERLTQALDAAWCEQYVLTPLHAALHASPFTTIYIAGGKAYQAALRDVCWPDGVSVSRAPQGSGIGVQLSALKHWLYETI